ncbi:hypothetical protein N657DRAFT_631553 [Parathielavia appendiculata]|uniref:Uncharacterized protein n=1 Tax=Parathielavia appendiculata TaxID=2587402 RepID=A0AAN6U7C3_9PEZI|nr:hypothetical protein N657DRAFT_631553 [Parathielavia appendiculata]
MDFHDKKGKCMRKDGEHDIEIVLPSHPGPNEPAQLGTEEEQKWNDEAIGLGLVLPPMSALASHQSPAILHSSVWHYMQTVVIERSVGEFRNPVGYDLSSVTHAKYHGIAQQVEAPSGQVTEGFIPHTAAVNHATSPSSAAMSNMHARLIEWTAGVVVADGDIGGKEGQEEKYGTDVGGSGRMELRREPWFSASGPHPVWVDLFSDRL